MDWWKLFSGTFILIFLAELGDKTQLAAMAKTADCPDSSTAKWIVFLAASLALAASTFIAVFMGQTLKALVPDERYIKIAAGILFLIFGFMILREVYASYQTRAVPETAAASSPPVEPGLVGGITLRAALEFEALTIRRYRLLAATASPEQAKVLLALAGEDEEHLKTLRGLPGEERRDATRDGGRERPVVAPETECGAIDQLIEYEEALAAFYQRLADRTLIPSVRSVLSGLAGEERRHAVKLRELAAGH